MCYGEITTGSRVFYLGKSYSVSLITENRQDIKIVLIHSKFKIYAPNKVSQRELNKDFWRLVKKYLSDYSIKNDKLRIFEKQL